MLKLVWIVSDPFTVIKGPLTETKNKSIFSKPPSFPNRKRRGIQKNFKPLGGKKCVIID